MTKVKVGVVGVGVLGKHHTRLYRQLDGADLVGVYDTDNTMAADVARQYDTRCFDTVVELADSVDCLSVAVPTHLHFEEVSRLLERGRHVLVEKPLTATVEQGRILLELARKCGSILHVGHVERYNPVINYLEEKLTNPRFIEAHRLAPYPPARPGLFPRGTEVSVVLDLMIHDIDIILKLVKCEIIRIDAVGIAVLSGTEDIANARINFTNGCVANLTASRISQETVRKIRVFQPNAYLSLDYQAKKGEIVTLDGGAFNRESVPIENYDALERELSEFVKCVRETLDKGKMKNPRSSAIYALKALEIAHQITGQIASKSA